MDASDPRWWSLLVAAVALAQPWVLAAYRKWLRPGTLDIYETGMIEISYGAAGPIVALLGTLRALHHDAFVRSIDVEVVRLQDGARHVFEWGALRSNMTTVAGAQSAALEVPTGFMLTTAQPYRYNIVFTDTVTARSVSDSLSAARDEWNRLLFASGIYTPNPPLTNESLARPEAVERIRAEYSKSASINAIYSDVDRRNYWEPGVYRIEIRVKTTRPDRTYKKSWTFTLSEADTRLIRANSGTMLAQITGSPGTFNFAYAKYQPV